MDHWTEYLGWAIQLYFAGFMDGVKCTHTLRLGTRGW